MLRNTFLKRFSELEISFNKLPYESSNSIGSSKYVPNGYWRQWATSAQNLIRAVFGESSPHYKNFLSLYERGDDGHDHEVAALKAVFMSAK